MFQLVPLKTFKDKEKGWKVWHAALEVHDWGEKKYISNHISIIMLSSVRRKKLPADRTWTTSRKSNATYHLTFCLYPCSCRLTLFVLWQQVFWLIWLFRRFVWSWNACRMAWDNWQHWSNICHVMNITLSHLCLRWLAVTRNPYNCRC